MASRHSTTSGSQDTVVGAFRIGKEIGRGSFATVYQGVHMKTKGLVAIKSVLRSKLNRKLLDNLESEISILKTLTHPHIVALLECSKSPTYIHLVMEYCSLGDLSIFIKKRDRLHSIPETAAMSQKYPSIGGGLNEVIVRHFLQQLSSALEFLRARNLIHRDVKPQNLLLEPPVVTYDERGPYGEGIVDAKRKIPEVGLPDLPVLKIADFGFARSLPSTSLAETLCGSPLYMAPEILRYEKYDAKADLWSVGTVLFEMIVGKPPFRASNHVELLRKIERGEDKIKFPEEAPASDGMKKLIRALLKRNPVERMSFVDFFNDPVIKEAIPGAIFPKTKSKLSLEREVAMSNRLSRGSDQMQDYFPPASPQPGPSKQLSPSPFLNDEQDARAAQRVNIARTTTQAPPSPRMANREILRPQLGHTTTAPARQREDRAPLSAPMERNTSQQTASPGSSFLIQRQLQNQQRPTSRESKEARERAEQDAMFVSDYVVIEKRTVEVNAFADEIAASPQLTGRAPSVTPPQSSAGALARRINSATSTPGRDVVSKRPNSYHQPRSNYDRKLGSSPSTTSSALAKALAMVNTRLHGISFLPPSLFPNYPQTGQQQYTAQGFHQPGSMVLVGQPSNTSGLEETDSSAVQAIEEAANRSDVVYQFAEVKFSQLIPASTLSQPFDQRDPVADDDSELGLTADAIFALSEEALVLYVKALSLLAHAMYVGEQWWSSKANEHNIQLTTAQVNASTRMNNAVQWVRDRFNEVLEKAEYVRRRLHEAQMQLPVSHPSHPSNRPASSNAGLGISTGGTGIIVSPGTTAEKLMYDRALEMSRTAAVNELVGEDLANCEVAYVTAIWMLEGVLEVDAESSEDGGVIQIEEDDRRTVEKFIASIRARLTILRKKAAEISRRSSGTHSMHSHHAASPSPPRMQSPTIPLAS